MTPSSGTFPGYASHDSRRLAGLMRRPEHEDTKARHTRAHKSIVRKARLWSLLPQALLNLALTVKACKHMHGNPPRGPGLGHMVLKRSQAVSLCAAAVSHQPEIPRIKQMVMNQPRGHKPCTLFWSCASVWDVFFCHLGKGRKAKYSGSGSGTQDK